MSECILWQGRLSLSGYPEASINGKKVRMNRIVLEQKLGRPLKAGMFACHSCDNPACVNPDHLWEGTHTDNMRDRQAKGRTFHGEQHWVRQNPERVPRGDSHYSRTRPHLVPKGERCRSARFTAAQVVEIRRKRKKGASIYLLAKTYGVSKTAIRYIVHRRNWKHVPEEVAS